jgi:hypothetical protein
MLGNLDLYEPALVNVSNNKFMCPYEVLPITTTIMRSSCIPQIFLFNFCELSTLKVAVLLALCVFVYIKLKKRTAKVKACFTVTTRKYTVSLTITGISYISSVIGIFMGPSFNLEVLQYILKTDQMERIIFWDFISGVLTTRMLKTFFYVC